MSNNSWELADNKDSVSLQINLLDKNVVVQNKATIVNRGQTNQLFLQLSHPVNANTALIYRIKGLPMTEKELNGVSLIELNNNKDKEVSQLIKLSDNDKYLLIIGDKLDPYTIKSDGALSLVIKFNLLVSQPTVLNSLTTASNTSSLLTPVTNAANVKSTKFAQALQARQAKLAQLKQTKDAKDAKDANSVNVADAAKEIKAKFADAIKAHQAKIAQLKAKHTGSNAVVNKQTKLAQMVKARQAKVAGRKIVKAADPFVLARAAPRITAQDVTIAQIYPPEVPTLPPLPALPGTLTSLADYIQIIIVTLAAAAQATILSALLAVFNPTCQATVSTTAAQNLTLALPTPSQNIIQAAYQEAQNNINAVNTMKACVAAFNNAV